MIRPSGQGNLSMNTQNMYQSPWLKAVDLQGKSHELAIASVEQHEFVDQKTGEKEMKLVVGFQAANGKHTSKRLILNGTQHNVIVKATCSYESDDWIGTKIILSPGVTSRGNDTIILSPGVSQPSAAGEMAF